MFRFKQQFQKMTASIILGFIFIVLPCSASTLKAESQAFMDPEGLQLPFGNEAEGRKAFIKLKCFSCHEVYFDREMPRPTAEKPGPVLGAPNRLHMKGEIVDAIISPSRHMLPSFEPEEKEKLSRMGKFNQTMTVQELIDITEYLMAQEE